MNFFHDDMNLKKKVPVTLYSLLILSTTVKLTTFLHIWSQERDLSFFCQTIKFSVKKLETDSKNTPVRRIILRLTLCIHNTLLTGGFESI